MRVSDLAIQVGLGIVMTTGVLLLIAALSALTAALTSPLLLFLRPAAGVGQIHGFEWGMITATVISLTGLVAPFFVDFSEFPWIRFWEYPAIVSLVFTTLIIRSTLTRASNPFIRQAATGAYVECIVLTVLVVAGVLWGRLASNETIRWSMMIGSFLYLLSTMSGFMKGVPTRMREFLVITKRHADLVESQRRLEQFAFLTGDVQDWRDANDAIVESQSLAQQAEGLLSQGKLDEASGHRAMARSW
jgi:hypothetical protein